MRRIAFSIAILVLVTGIVALVTGAFRQGGADVLGNAKGMVGPARYPTHFGLPPVGAHGSLPADSRLLLQISPASGEEWDVYANGYIVTDPLRGPRFQRRLTPQRAHLLWSGIRAIGRPVGLFRHDRGFVRKAYAKPERVDRYRVRRGSRLTSVQVLPPGISNDPTETPAQIRALDRIDTLVAHLASRLPASARADATIRPYVPAQYQIVHDHPPPDPAMLPSPAKEALRQFPTLIHGGCIVITTDQARALITAFVAAGVKYNFKDGLTSFDVAAGRAYPNGTILDFHQVLPDINTC